MKASKLIKYYKNKNIQIATTAKPTILVSNAVTIELINVTIENNAITIN